MSRDLDRRDFMRTAGAAGVAGLAGCSSLGEENTDTEDRETDTSSDRATNTPQDPTYDIRVSALEYDLTDLATSETNQHDQAYVEENYSVELGVTVLENGQEASLDKLGEVHLEDEEGERVETTEEGYVPEYAVEDGQELTVRAEVDGETLQDSVTVSKELPDNFLVDASLVEDGEVLYETPWNTPYQFDSHTTDRQAFLDRRAQLRDEVAEENVVGRINKERIREVWENDVGNSEIEKKKAALAMARSSTVGTATWDGIGVNEHATEQQAANEEIILRELDIFPDYDEVFIGSFTNPEEPEYDENGNKQIDGVEVDSKVAYIDGDWFHAAGAPNGSPQHITDVENIEMVDATSSSYAANSVLAEFEEEMERIDELEKMAYTDDAVSSPVTVSGSLTREEMLSSFPISWSMLESIRNNENWSSFMPQIELAADIEHSDNIGGETVGGDIPESMTLNVGEDTSNLHILKASGEDSTRPEGTYRYQTISQSMEDVKEEFLR